MDCAGMAELADAQASGACGSNIVWVQVPSPASFLFFIRLRKYDPSLTGFFISMDRTGKCISSIRSVRYQTRSRKKETARKHIFSRLFLFIYSITDVLP